LTEILKNFEKKFDYFHINPLLILSTQILKILSMKRNFAFKLRKHTKTLF